MLTPSQLLYALALPAAVALVLGGIGRWLGWRWVMPLAAGGAFLAAYAALGIATLPPRTPGTPWLTWAAAGIPRLPPADGTDWLFWLAIPVTVLGVVDALLGGRWGWVLGASAGAVGVGILRPLSAMIDPQTLWITVGVLAVAGGLLAWVAGYAERRAGPLWTIGVFAAALAGAGVMVMSSNLQTVGVYGLAAAAAVAPIAFVAGRKVQASRSVAVVAAPLLAGLLAAGRHYPDPGVPLTQGVVLLLAPVLLLAGALLPIRREWARGLIGALAVIIAVAAVTAPSALAAKKAAETPDPYGGAYGK
jgi:hypothetical protein